MNRVFVYGTLKSGEPNHHWITDANNGKASFLGNGVTKTAYPLIIGTRYNIPFLLYKPGTGHKVNGEVYEVDDAMLEKLDELEDHPAFYERQIEEIECIKSDFKAQTSQPLLKCWVYFLKSFRQDLLNMPMLQCYLSAGDHGLPYCERYLRDPNFKAQEEVYLQK